MFPLTYQQYPSEDMEDGMDTDRMLIADALKECEFHYYWEFGECQNSTKSIYLVLSEFGYRYGDACFGYYDFVSKKIEEGNPYQKNIIDRYNTEAKFWVDRLQFLVSKKNIPQVELYYLYPETKEDLKLAKVVNANKLCTKDILQLQVNEILQVKK